MLLLFLILGHRPDLCAFWRECLLSLYDVHVSVVAKESKVPTERDALRAA